MPTSVRVFAPAKVNLTLHVTGRRNDGYHGLDSLVAFADVGDSLELTLSDTPSLALTGPYADAVPSGGDNLVLKVAGHFAPAPPIGITLTKNLPVASGIGGGSADAAAVFRGLTALLGADDRMDKPSDDSLQQLLPLGADIPMCVASITARIGGIGEKVVSVSGMPVLPAVLVNPNCAVSTPLVFQAMSCRENAPMPDPLPSFSCARDLIGWLSKQRNDLETAALQVEPEIFTVKSALAQTQNCRFVRMSGSGATCFGLFETRRAADNAARLLQTAHPDWWVVSTSLGSQADGAAPQIS
ncbi:MAG: 4-(cytidine 5'-diphospho)-2-C-methyl-D-erythritol kinase [Roseobacter sp.]